MNNLFLVTLLTWLGLGTEAAASKSLYPLPDPPNILWISCEDMSPRLGCYGDPTVPTPYIDRLAREGIRYTNAYCTAGVCAPSRSAIITGMYQTTTGGHNMRTLLNTFPEQTRLPAEYSIVPPPEVKAFPEYLRAAGYYCTNNAKTDYQFVAPPTVWDEVGKNAHWRNRPAGKPFFAVFNYEITHESQVWARSDHPMRVDPAKAPVPPYYPDTKTVRKDIARHYSNISELDDAVGELLAQLEADGLLDQTIIFFWSDHGDGLPFYKREIYSRGLLVPLLVRFPDGRMAGEVDEQLISMIDLASTVLSLAGIPTPKPMQGQAFLGPYSAKKPRRYIFAARDRIDSEYDRVRTVLDDRFQYVHNFYPDKPLYMDIQYRLQQDMMRELLALKSEGKLNDDQRFWFRETKPVEELYDWRADPYELHDLAADPQYRSVLKRLRRELDRWERRTRDLGSIPEMDLVRQMWSGAGEPPITAAPVLERKGGRLTIRCATEGASIGYRILESGKPEPKGWAVYTGPVDVPIDATVKAMAMRIGYRPSETVK